MSHGDLIETGNSVFQTVLEPEQLGSIAQCYQATLLNLVREYRGRSVWDGQLTVARRKKF